MKLTKTQLKQIIREEIQNLNESETNIMKLDPEEQKKIVAQYEAIRKNGQFNMMDFLSVQRAAFENGYYNFVNFTQNNSRAYGSILIDPNMKVNALSIDLSIKKLLPLSLAYGDAIGNTRNA